MFLVGLTGGIATGKSTVSLMLAKLGVPIIDSDVAAKKVVEPGKKAWKQIKAEFGEDILLPDGQIDRKLLADIIFKDSAKRSKLNQITHPEVFKFVCGQIVKAFFQGHQFVIIDTPLLFEAKLWTKYLHYVIVVTCEKDLELQRLMDRNKLSEKEAMVRIEAQMPIEEKCSQADFVIDNSSTVEDTQEQLMQVYHKLRKSRAHWKVRAIVVTVLSLVSGGIYFVLKRAIF